MIFLSPEEIPHADKITGIIRPFAQQHQLEVEPFYHDEGVWLVGELQPEIGPQRKIQITSNRENVRLCLVFVPHVTIWDEAGSRREFVFRVPDSLIKKLPFRDFLKDGGAEEQKILGELTTAWLNTQSPLLTEGAPSFAWGRVEVLAGKPS